MWGGAIVLGCHEQRVGSRHIPSVTFCQGVKKEVLLPLRMPCCI